MDVRTGEIFDYRRRSDVLDRQILAPTGSPEWIQDRAALWNAVELAERRKDAQVAREIQLSLPHELSLDANHALVREFALEQFVARGMAADIAIHAAHRGGDERNIHAHILLTTRRLAPGGFAGKERSWNERESLETWRAEWARHVNRALELARVHARVDHRSNAELGIDREPEPKQGAIATTMERKGVRSHAGDDRRRVRERNAERDRLREEARSATEAIREAEKRYESARQRESEAEHLGIGPADVPHWQLLREEALSGAYATEMAGTALARFWRLTETHDGLVFENARGHFEDHGSMIVARTGNEVEIRAMLDLAAIKGWQSLRVTGTDNFKIRVMRAAANRGFTVEAKGRDAHLWSQVNLNRSLARSPDADTRQRSERGPHSPGRDDYERER